MKNMGANTKFGVSIINLVILLVVMTATGLPAVKFQKQSEEAEPYKLASEYMKGKRWQDLVELCQRSLRDKPSDAEMMSILGVAYSELGRHQESLDAFKRVVQLRP